ncbi:MAG: TonB-dependent receptor [Rhizomicrobium sp.]|nr:TonB-dependent receptor [Rhizomicrobium sp.]
MMKTMKPTALMCTLILTASASHAQSMDYGAIAQLFGEPGTTSATGSPQRATDVPTNMVIVTADDIARSGARDIPGILRHVEGLDVLQWASDDFDASARGYNQAYSARTLVLVDGRQVYADSFGFTPWSTVPVELSSIRQIEIVKGPNAALFGFNAVAGVINIITKNPRYDDSTSLTARYGSQNLSDTSAVGRLAIGKDVFVRLSGDYRLDKPFGTSNPLPLDGDLHTHNERAALDADAVIVLPADLELEIGGTYSEAKQNEVSAGYKLQTSEYQTKSLLARLTGDTDFGLFKLNAYNNWFDWTRAVAPGIIAPKLKNTVTVVQAEDVFTVASDHTIRIAGEYRHNEVGTRNPDDGWVSFDAGSASAMWNWQIVPQVAFTTALRFDSIAYNSVLPKVLPSRNGPALHIDEWNFNSGLVWNADSQDTFRLLAARGVQLPNLVQVWDAAASQGGSKLLQLAPSTVTNFEALWNHHFAWMDTRLQVAVYHQDTYDVISTGSGTIEPTGMPGLAPINVGSSRADGLEISSEGRFDEQWRWSASYRLEVINDKYTHGGSRTDLINYQDTTPQHVVKTNLGWDSEPWSADVFLQFQSDTQGLRRIGPFRIPVPIGSFATVDARLSYRLTDSITVALSGQNLLLGTQQQTSGPEVERQFFVSLSYGG